METIAKIRRDRLIHGKSIKAIARERGVSRNTVRKVLRTQAVAFRYERAAQPLPKLGAYVERLEGLLEENVNKSRRERLTLMRIFEALQAEGYRGGYDAVRRYAKRWQRMGGGGSAEAFVPLVFAPGEAYQFDWSHEVVVLAGVTTKVKVAHVRLCHSRMPFVRAYPRESQEMVFVGKARRFNRRFEQMCSHYLVEPVACTPAAGWEKGQVENQVGVSRQRFFTPRLRFASYAELNAWLLERCVAYAQGHPHPEQRERSVFEVFAAERPALVPYPGPFDGYRATIAAVSKTCLVRFDHNRYSVPSRALGRPVEVMAYAERIVIRQDGEVLAEHPRRFGRGHSVYDPWHYVPVLSRKPGALRNGAPFKGWVLPGALGRVQRRLRRVDDGDRQMVDILHAVLSDGLEAVEAACAEALAAGVASSDVVLNVLARRAEPSPLANVLTPSALALGQAPMADCARYDRLRSPYGAF